MPLGDQEHINAAVKTALDKMAEKMEAEAKAMSPSTFLGRGRKPAGGPVTTGTMSGHGWNPALSTYDPYAYGNMTHINVMDPIPAPVYSPSLSAIEEEPTLRRIEVMSLGNGRAIDLKTGEIHDTWWHGKKRP